MVTALLDLVLPVACAGCGSPAGPTGACPECLQHLAQTTPYPTRPTPAPTGFPCCLTGGEYGGVLQEMIVAYKDRGAHALANPLGTRLAQIVAAGLAGASGAGPLVLVPVPDSAPAARARHGDHMRRLARSAARRLRRGGWPATVAVPLRARSRADSTRLGRAARTVAAQGAFVARPGRMWTVQAATARGAQVVVLDDVVTTGATLAAVTRLLTSRGITVAGAATLAATQLRLSAADTGSIPLS